MRDYDGDVEVAVPERWADARRRLVPVLRRCTDPPRAWQAGRADAANRLVRRPLVPFVHEVLAIDLDDVRLLVGRGHLATWGVDEEVAVQAAHANLSSIATQGLKPRPEYGLWQIDAGDGYETSRLALPGFLHAFEHHLGGRPVAIVPANRVLLVGSDAPASLERMLILADAVFRRADARLCPVPVTIDTGGHVVPLALPADHPQAPALHAAEALLAAHEYEAQREQIVDADLDTAVSPVQLVHHADTGHAWTVARWEEGAREVLLARTDRVALVDAQGRELLVAWDALERAAAACLVATELDPPRVRARWPSSEALAALAVGG